MSDPFHHIGTSVPRLEDQRLLTGSGCFIDDVTVPDMAAMVVLRSPHAHAHITEIDLSAARAAPGVIDVFVAGDLDQPQPEIPIRLAPFKGFERFLQRPLAEEKVRYVGEPVAVIVAEDRYLAEDAAELIEIAYDILPAVTNVDQALSGEVLLHDQAGENLATAYSVGRGDVEAVLAAATYVRRERFVTNRHAACPLETRGLLATYGPQGGSLRLEGAVKVTWFNRRHLAAAFGLSESDVVLVEHDVGGGFGARGELYPEDYLTPIASGRCGRPVKWVEDRRENLMAANHSRDITCELEIAAKKDGTILGMKAVVQGDLGAYIRTNGGVVPSKAAQFLPGPYRVPAFACDVQALVTNKTPVGTYRGPGRFEANFFRERMIDLMAADLDLDPAAVRLRNLMTPEELPYRIGELVPGDPDATYDEGDYPAAFKTLLDEAGYEDWRDRQGERDSDGRLLGLGLACFVESSAAGPPETARVTIDPVGGIEIRVGASSLGQGTETAMAQICAECLEIPIANITVRHGSTDLLETGGGTFHSRNTVMAGNAVRVAAENLRGRALELAALRLNLAVDDLTYRDGAVHHKTEQREAHTLAALASFDELTADGSFDNGGKISWSYGAHAALVAVDVETGGIEILRYVLTEEVGRVLHPEMLRGQAVGGVIQGLGGALLDHMIYDDHGQLVTGTFADYLLPTSDIVPEITAIALEESPSKANPMGFKGAGEGGIVAVAGAVANAVGQALGPDGPKIDRLPLSPSYIRALLTE